MVRASSAHRICTNRPINNKEKFAEVTKSLKEACSKKDITFNITDLKEYENTTGLKTIAKSFSAEWKKNVDYLQDPLPPGAKSYLQELWLQDNYNFVICEPAYGEMANTLMKGTYSEDRAIKVLSSVHNKEYEKHEGRVTKGFLTGECDIKYKDEKIIDIKVPKDFLSFRKKSGVENTYYWQIISYCYLYDVPMGELAYILMPTPAELEERTYNKLTPRGCENLMKMDKTIINLPPEQRAKVFSVKDNVASDIEFLKVRLDKAEEYYKSLTYERCMKML